MLKKYEIKSTFFIPGWIMERYPEIVEKIMNEDHELAHHGYLHEWPDQLQEEQETAAFEKASETFKKHTGFAPRGYRSPAWEFSPNTLKILIEHNFLFSSNMMTSEHPYEYISAGKRTGLIELPVSWTLDDAPFFLLSLTTPGRVVFPPEVVAGMWKEELQLHYEDQFATCFVLTMHPQVIGHPSRLRALERLIQYACGLPAAYFSTCGELSKIIRNDEKRKEVDINEILGLNINRE